MTTSADALKSLRRRGKRLTPARRAVVEATYRLPAHFTFAELCAELDSLGIHRATLFRTLALLEQSGLLKRLPGNRNGAVRFESVRGEHRWERRRRLHPPDGERGRRLRRVERGRQGVEPDPSRSRRDVVGTGW